MAGNSKSGRRKGIPNKRTQDVIDKLAALNCDPLQGMATIAEKAMANKDYNLAGQMYRELAQYVAPKRKAVEMSGEVDSKLTVQALNYADHNDPA